MPQRDNRGIGGFTPFPTFAPGGEGGLIPTVKMPQSRMSFPTPRGGGGGSRKVKPLERLAGIVPYGIEAAFNAFEEPPKILSEEEYYETIRPEGAPIPEEPTELEKARYQAYQVVGPAPEQDRFDAETIAMMAGSLATGRGSDQYNQTVRNMRSSKQSATNAKEARRASIIQDYLKDKKIPFENYIDTNKLISGKGRVEVTGYTHPNLGLLLRDPENNKAIKDGPYKGYAQQEYVDGNFVKSGTFDEARVSGFKNEDVEAMMDKTKEFNAHDIGTINTLQTVNSLVQTLQNSEGEPLALVGGALSVFADDVNTNLSNLANVMGYGRNPTALFSQNQKGGTEFKGSGLQIAELKLLTDERRQLVADEQNTEELDAKIIQAYNTFHGSMQDTGDKRLNFTLFEEDLMEKSAFERVTALSDYITLGYQIAGTRFGQTGRTLSDKDLAFALQSIGYGATQNKEIAIAQLMKVGDAMLTQNDVKIRYTHNPGDYTNLIWNDNKINAYKDYWQPTLDKDGNPDWNSNSDKWKYINLEERAAKRLGDTVNPVKTFRDLRSKLYTQSDRTDARVKQQIINIPDFTKAQNDLLNRLNNK